MGALFVQLCVPYQYKGKKSHYAATQPRALTTRRVSKEGHTIVTRNPGSMTTAENCCLANDPKLPVFTFNIRAARRFRLGNPYAVFFSSMRIILPAPSTYIIFMVFEYCTTGENHSKQGGSV